MAYGSPEINEYAIKCEECGKWYKKITHAHLYKMHGLTIDKYKEKWGYKKTQPLEAFYIKSIRQKCNERDKAYLNIIEHAKKHKFKKGQGLHPRRISAQELYRLKKIATRYKDDVMFLMPAEVVCIFDLHYKLRYPYERIGKILRISDKTVKRILKLENVYNRWKNYYKSHRQKKEASDV